MRKNKYRIKKETEQENIFPWTEREKNISSVILRNKEEIKLIPIRYRDYLSICWLLLTLFFLSPHQVRQLYSNLLLLVEFIIRLQNKSYFSKKLRKTKKIVSIFFSIVIRCQNYPLWQKWVDTTIFFCFKIERIFHNNILFWAIHHFYKNIEITKKAFKNSYNSPMFLSLKTFKPFLASILNYFVLNNKRFLKNIWRTCYFEISKKPCFVLSCKTILRSCIMIL